MDPANPHKKFKKSALLSLVVVGLLAVSTVVVSQRLLTPVGKPEKSNASVYAVPWTYPRQLRVIILEYFDPASQPAYRDPNKALQIVNEIQQDIHKVSSFHANPQALPSLQVQIVDTYSYNEAAPSKDIYWEDAYNSMLARPLTHAGDNNRSLCDRIVADNIDQIWFIADSTTGNLVKGPENAISSKYIRGNIVPGYGGYSVPANMFCNGRRSFSINYFDISRTDITLHSLGHYTETLISTVQGPEVFDKQYMGVTYSTNIVDGQEIPGAQLSSSCGNIHVPPNVNIIVSTNPTLYKGGVYDLTNQVQSSCPYWKPDGSGLKTPVDSNTWNNDPNLSGTAEGKYIEWWFSNMPNINNNLLYQGQLLPDWWDFMVNTDATIEYYLSGGYYMNPALQSVGPTQSCTATSGTTTTCNFNN